MNRKGMTLIEVLMVIILVSIIAAIVIPRFGMGTQRAKVQSCEMNRSVINTAVEVWYLSEGTWPIVDLRDIRSNQNYFPDGIPTCPVDTTSYVLETTRFRVSGHREGAQSHIW